MPFTTTVRAVRRALPDGGALPESDWWRRHRLLTWVLALHVPAVAVFALVVASPIRAAVGAALPAALVIVAVVHGDRRVRALAVSTGLITCSAVFVHLSGGRIEWHFHSFVVLALVALYQEWLVYLMALGFVLVQHGLGSWLHLTDDYSQGSGDLRWALVHGGFVLATIACHITSWSFNAAETERAEGYRHELEDGEQSLRARMGKTARIRDDLIATASHEFRTPLTVISGAAATLQRHGDSLSAIERSSLLEAIMSRSERLGQMLESMLIGAQDEPAEGSATSLRSVVDEVLPESGRGRTLSVEVPEDIWVACGSRPLIQLVERLVDSARLKGDLGATVSLRARAVAIDVLVEVRVSAVDLDEDDITGLFDPFRGGTDPVPRSGEVGLGLYAARRIAETHGGTARVSLDRGMFVVGVQLPRAPVQLPEPRAPWTGGAASTSRSRRSGTW